MGIMGYIGFTGYRVRGLGVSQNKGTGNVMEVSEIGVP